MLILGGLWIDLFRILQPEWEVNEQYSYGYFVPLIGAYLIHLRWQDRPNPSLPCPQAVLWLWALSALCVGLLLPLHVLHTANPEWRMVYWAFAGAVTGVTFLILILLGGRSWILHFGFPVCMFLFAVPWPTLVEEPLVQQLMRLVAATTVEVANLCGVRAVQEGNLIHLSSTPIGVEEACSGVRSLQSNIMAAFFFGELFRFVLGLRFFLLVAGVVLSIILNLIRTLALTYAAHTGGADKLNAWHDAAGNTAAIAGFVILLVFAGGINALWQKCFPSRVDVGSTSQTFVHPRMISLRGSVLLGVLWAFSLLGNYAWYADWGKSPADAYSVNIDWQQAVPNVEFVEINERTRAILRYSEGVQASWLDDSQRRWTAFYFLWEPGMVSSFAGVHRPDACLPAAGFTLEETLPEPYIWNSGAGLKIAFKTYIFSHSRGLTHVFFAVWDDASGSETPQLASTAEERVDQALAGRKVGRRRQIQFVVHNAASLEDARVGVEAFMNQAVTVSKDSF